MHWTDNLVAASFRGVPFSVHGRPSAEGGRFDAEHNFKGRKLPYIEDLGGKGRTFRIEGFVVGDDFMARRDKLLAALDTPGQGTLVHPFYGSLRVNSRGWSCTDGDRYAALTLTFTESASALHPSSAQDTSSVVVGSVEAGVAESLAVLDELVGYTGAGWVLDSTLAAVKDMAGIVAAARTAVADPAGFAVLLARTLDLAAVDLSGMSSPGNFLLPLFQDEDLDNVLDHAARARELLELASSFPVPAVPQRLTPSRLQEAANLTGLARFGCRIATAELARSASQIIPESTTAATELRDQVTGAIDTVLETAETDSIFSAFSELRAATVRDMVAKAKGAPQVATVQPRLVENVFTLAHRARTQGADIAAQVDGLLARNNIRHPGFPGQGGLEVLRG